MLRCVSPYKSSLGQFGPGDVIEDMALQVALRIDSPGSFEVVVSDDPATDGAGPADVEAVTKPVKAATRKAVR